MESWTHIVSSTGQRFVLGPNLRRGPSVVVRDDNILRQGRSNSERNSEKDSGLVQHFVFF